MTRCASACLWCLLSLAGKRALKSRRPCPLHLQVEVARHEPLQRRELSFDSPRMDRPVIVQTGDIADACSDTSLTVWPLVKSIDATCQLAKKIP